MIYEPREDSILLEKQVSKLALGRVLDLGTGSGIQALTLIKSPYVREVVAADISKGAIEKLNEQIKKQRLRKIKVPHSDLFEQVRGQFNTIIFNPPYLPQDKNIQDEAIYGGKKGWEISERFFLQVNQFLVPSGKIIFLFSSQPSVVNALNFFWLLNLFKPHSLAKKSSAKKPTLWRVFAYSSPGLPSPTIRNKLFFSPLKAVFGSFIFFLVLMLLCFDVLVFWCSLCSVLPHHPLPPPQRGGEKYHTVFLVPC